MWKNDKKTFFATASVIFKNVNRIFPNFHFPERLVFKTASLFVVEMFQLLPLPFVVIRNNCSFFEKKSESVKNI